MFLFNVKETGVFIIVCSFNIGTMYIDFKVSLILVTSLLPSDLDTSVLP